MIPDFSIYEEPIKKDIEDYLKLYKEIYNQEQAIMRQMKDNIELFDFLNLKESSKDTKDKLKAMNFKIEQQCCNYADFLHSKSNTIEGTLDYMSTAAKNTKEAKELKRVCDNIRKKADFIIDCIDDPIYMIMFCKGISKRKAIKKYLKDFPNNNIVKNHKKDFKEKFVIISLILSMIIASGGFLSWVICLSLLISWSPILFLIAILGSVSTLIFSCIYTKNY